MDKFKELRRNLQTALKFTDGKLDKDTVTKLNRDFGTKRIVWNEKDDLLLTSDKFRRRLISVSVLINTMKRKKDVAREAEYKRIYDLMNGIAKIKDDDMLTIANSIQTQVHGEDIEEDDLEEYLEWLNSIRDVYDIENLFHPYLKNNNIAGFYLKHLNPKYKRIIF